jgi:hypothetical protein
MAFIYNELDASESRDFELHLKQCATCSEEAASFGGVRESIVAWRDEVLTGFMPSAATPARRSAMAALRQFFDLSPLWLKGAAAFAVLTFCVLAGLAYVSLKKEPDVAKNNDALYTQQDVDRMVNEALAKQKTIPDENTTDSAVATFSPPPSQPKKPIKQPAAARNRRPLSRAEREQLAADLRLLPTDDGLDLFDRINQ